MRCRRHSVRFGIGLLWLTPVAVLTPFVLGRPVYLAIRLPFAALSVLTLRIVVFALNPPLGAGDRVDRLLDALNAELVARRGSRSTDPDSARCVA